MAIWGSEAVEKVLNAQVSVSLKMSTLLMVLFVASGAAALLVRYYVTTKYSRLSKDLDSDEAEDQAMAAEMWREPTDSDLDSLVNEKDSTASPFDEFLKAVKVFGFLDNEVFAELTKTTQTLRIQEGESVKLAELGGFAVVISGVMEVYCQSERPDSEGEQDLLNEITVSSPISSLSSILSLFSNGIEPQQRESEFDRVNATTFAVAKEAATIVIIPADAFRQLTLNYPNAAANIVQVILFRWSQVTFRTCQRYLNLTQQFYQTELSLNATAKSRIDQTLPKWLIDDAVKQLKACAAEASSDEKVVELKNRSVPMCLPRHRKSSVEIEADISSSLPSMGGKPFLNSSVNRSHNVYIDSGDSRRSSAFPGDLLSHASLNYHTAHVPGGSLNGSFVNLSDQAGDFAKPRKPTPNGDTEESVLRRAIVEIMFATIMFDSQEPHAMPYSAATSPTANMASGFDFTGNSSVNSSNGNSNSNSNSNSVNSSVNSNSANSNGNANSNNSNSSVHNGNGNTGSHGNTAGSGTTAGTGSSNAYGVSGRGSVPSLNGKIGLEANAKRLRSQTATDPRRGGSRPKIPSQLPRLPASFNNILDDAADMVELLWYRKGEYVSRYGERCRGLIYVLEGSLEVGYHPVLSSADSEKEGKKYERLYDVETGNITGFLETISSSSSFVDLIANRDTCVAVISKSYFETLAEIYPLLYISAAKSLTTSLTRPIVQLDFALEWISIKSGGHLLREGAKANAIYFVLNGRMRAYHQKQLIGDYGHGSTIGELETMIGETYSASVVAARDTELSRFPRTLVECLARQYPAITFEMSRMVVQAMRARNSVLKRDQNILNDFKTLAILPTLPGLPVEDFALKLRSAFQTVGRDVKVLTNSIILRYLGKYAFQKMGALKLRAYLADLEDRFDILLYVADGSSTSQWTRTCIDQADCVLLLADGSASPVFNDVERMVVRSPTRSRAHLVLLHNEKQVNHGSTAKWLKHRPWISAHHHIQMAFVREEEVEKGGHAGLQQNRVQRKISQIKNRVQDEIKLLQQRKLLKLSRENYDYTGHSSGLQYKNDFNRLARVLAGEAVGLVLGGGGARGLSHIGVLQALEEAGIPIDMVGGTSIGSLIGGLYAQDYDIVPLLRKSKRFSVHVSSFWRLLLDLTYPAMAWTTGHAFNRAVWKTLGDSRIEDFWVKYFTNTTNLTLSRMEVHQRGYAWRYIRASMSLAGLLPPIEENGQMLLDGGYVDNLPVSEMKKMGARYIIAVDVGAVDDTTPLKYGDTLSGVWALVNKWNPFSSTPNVPNIAEIQQRLTYVSSVKALEEAKVADGVIYLRPPIDNYATLDFAKFDEIREAGHAYCTSELHRVTGNKLLSIFPRNVNKSGPRIKYRRHSF